MREYRRKHPIFSLCGLGCGLCPRFHAEGESRCPGCGGKDFHLKHPACAVINCSKKHGNVEFCFECEAYPCERYKKPSEKDSFISYRNVNANLERARNEGIMQIVFVLQKKMDILSELIKDHNDGKSKGFYCLAASLLDLDDLEKAKDYARSLSLDAAGRAKSVSAFLKGVADEKEIDLALRK